MSPEDVRAWDSRVASSGREESSVRPVSTGEGRGKC